MAGMVSRGRGLEGDQADGSVAGLRVAGEMVAIAAIAIQILYRRIILGHRIVRVGIGTTNIQNGVEFQIESNSKGLLIPRVALTATNVVAPVGPAPIAIGVLVFNTATAGAGITAVTPGFYYWSGTEWVALKSSPLAASQDWSLTGNAGTVFVGNTSLANVSFSMFGSEIT